MWDSNLNNLMLNATQLSALKNYADQLLEIPSKISRSMETYNYCITEQNMAAWIAGSAAGQSVSKRITSAINSCEEINSIIKKTVDTILTAVSEAQANGSKTI